MKIEDIPQLNAETCFVVHSCHPKTTKPPVSSSQDSESCEICTGISPHEKCEDLFYREASHFTKSLKQCTSTFMPSIIKSEKIPESSFLEDGVKEEMRMKTKIVKVTETEINCSFPIINRYHSSRRIALLQQLFPYDITNYCVSDKSYS